MERLGSFDPALDVGILLAVAGHGESDLALQAYDLMVDECTCQCGSDCHERFVTIAGADGKSVVIRDNT